MAVVRQPMTLAKFLALQEEEPALEFADGEVTQKVSPKGQHSRLQVTLVECFNQFAEPRRFALAFSELRATFAGASPVPDVAVYRWERIPVDQRREIVNDFREPPDIAIEIVSPEQSVNALVRRCLWYVANGVGVALLVDPADRSVLLFRPGEMPRPLRGPDPIDVGEILPGFELTVQELFDALRIR